MSSQPIDADAYTTPFQLTAKCFRDVYPAIDPTTNKAVRADGKVVIITGAAGGLGFGIAKSFIAGGAKGIVLVGRNQKSLEAVVADLKSDSTKLLPLAGDITSDTDVDAIYNKVLAAFGKVDVLVNAAGAMNVGPIGVLEPPKWWENFEVNTRGVFNTSSGFIKATGGEGTIINLVTLGASFVAPGLSGYSASKLAVIKFGEFLDVEQPKLRVFSVHPGMVEAEGGRGMVVEPFLPFSKDKAALTGGLSVYLTTPKADFLRGGYLHANWDVEELKKHKDEITEKKLIKLGFLNAQLQPGGYPWSA
ncbi:hypothetical protein VPNG_01590 [Cytospora leucostoma]|uniref:NAD(P)-binding protein n=1 Tax=Cytospora leucostoma TaxID=1230097 RepID=A0A423XK98_9PEZI|nr:hypothetical protein VPNG_01590 [Cytospora leucostoma]